MVVPGMFDLHVDAHNSRYQDLLRESQNAHLIKQMREERVKGVPFSHRVLSHLGKRLVDWGYFIQERYSPAYLANLKTVSDKNNGRRSHVDNAFIVAAQSKPRPNGKDEEKAALARSISSDLWFVYEEEPLRSHN